MDSDEEQSDDIAGTAFDYKLPDSTVPDLLRIQSLEQQCLAVMNSTSGIEFQCGWAFEDVQKKLIDLFPVAFQWFEAHPYGIDFDRDEPPFALCVRSKRHLHLVPGVVRPTGEKVYVNSHVSRAGFKECTVFLSGFFHITLRNLKTYIPLQPLVDRSHHVYSRLGQKGIISCIRLCPLFLF